MNLGGSGIWSPVPHPRTKAIMSLAGSNVSSFSLIRSQDYLLDMSRPTTSCAYSIILHANLGYGISECPHDILHHYHPVLFEILHMLTSQLKYRMIERETHITETSPFRFPLCGGSFQDLDKLPEILLIPSDRLTDPLELGLYLLQVFTLRESSICGVGIQFEAVGFVLLLGLYRELCSAVRKRSGLPSAHAPPAALCSCTTSPHYSADLS